MTKYFRVTNTDNNTDDIYRVRDNNLISYYDGNYKDCWSTVSFIDEAEMIRVAEAFQYKIEQIPTEEFEASLAMKELIS